MFALIPLDKIKKKKFLNAHLLFILKVPMKLRWGGGRKREGVFISVLTFKAPIMTTTDDK